MRAAFPDWLEPMAATLTQERFAGPEWIFEQKFDGIRLIAFKHGKDIRLLSRNKLPQNASYPAVVAAIDALPVRDVILDGEATGVWGKQGRVAYHVFDILWLDGRDLTALPLVERRDVVEHAATARAHRTGAVARRRQALGAGLRPAVGKASSPSGATRRTNTADRSTG